jgi:integrase
MLISDAMERGHVPRKVVRELRRGKERKADRRAKGKLKIGVDIPTPDEIRALLPCLKGRWRPILLTAIFCGLRGSELRGLRWQDVDLVKGEIHVRQRADRYHKIGRPKSEAGERTVPVPPLALNALKLWKLACPMGDLGLAFPNPSGKVERYRRRSRRASLMRTARKNTVARTAFGISSHRGASTGGLMAAWNCRSRWSKPGWATARSR